MEIKFRRLTPTARIPSRGSSSAAGYDLYADLEQDTVIPPHKTVMISSGLAMEIPEGYFGAIFARSGLYRGPWMIPLHNDSEETRTVTPGERIAQMVVIPFLPVEFKETEALSDTARGSSGFGSTGRN